MPGFARAAVLLWACLWAAVASPDPERHTVLQLQGPRFTLNQRPVFLLGFSYFAALGAPDTFIQQDLRDFHSFGFNWLRVFATWDAYGTNLSAVTTAGDARQPFLSRLKRLVTECDRLGMAVDITLARGKSLPTFNAHLKATRTLVIALKGLQNWSLDLANEHDVGDARHVSLPELNQLRSAVRRLDPGRLVTASFGGHDLSRSDVRGAIEQGGVDFICPHRPRNRSSPGQTEGATLKLRGYMHEDGGQIPVLFQEPFRRGYNSWQPRASDFLTDLRGAVQGGAAGWCFHNGAQAGASGERPRRSFDLRTRRLVDQLDPEEMKVLKSANAVLAGN